MLKISNEEKIQILEMHQVKGVVTEQAQTDPFLEKNYVNKLITNGFRVVNNFNLPDGEYKKMGGGYMFKVRTLDDNPTRYAVITTDGITGQYTDETFKIVSGVPDVRYYKLFERILDL